MNSMNNFLEAAVTRYHVSAEKKASLYVSRAFNLGITQPGVALLALLGPALFALLASQFATHNQLYAVGLKLTAVFMACLALKYHHKLSHTALTPGGEVTRPNRRLAKFMIFLIGFHVFCGVVALFAGTAENILFVMMHYSWAMSTLFATYMLAAARIENSTRMPLAPVMA